MHKTQNTTVGMLTLDELRVRVARSTKEAKKLDAQIVVEWAECLRRKAYNDWGYDTMHRYVTKELGWDDGSANRRIRTAQSTLRVPEVAKDIATGNLGLTQVQAIENHVLHEKYEQKNNVGKKEVRKILQAVRGKSVEETKRFLAERSTSPKVEPKRETIRYLKGGDTSFTFSATPEQSALFEQAKSLMSHKYPLGRKQDIFFEALKEWVLRHSPYEKAKRAESRRAPTSQRSGNASSGRYIEAIEKHAVWRRNDNKGCEYIDPKTGKRCASKHRLEVHHVQAHAKGGKNTADNLQVFCQKHNLHQAELDFGHKVTKHRPDLSG